MKNLTLGTLNICIINPTVKYMYHVYSFVLATAWAVYASTLLAYAAHAVAKTKEYTWYIYFTVGLILIH